MQTERRKYMQLERVVEEYPSSLPSHLARFANGREIENISVDVIETPIKSTCGAILLMMSFFIYWWQGPFLGTLVLLFGCIVRIIGMAGVLALRITYRPSGEDIIRVCTNTATRRFRLEQELQSHNITPPMAS